MKQPEIIHHSRGRTPRGEPNPIDVHVGKRIRLRRSLILMSQVNLAKLLGIIFQQIQKYERGMNRISASRLWDMSRVLKVPAAKPPIHASPAGCVADVRSKKHPRSANLGDVLALRDYKVAAISSTS